MMKLAGRLADWLLSMLLRRIDIKPIGDDTMPRVWSDPALMSNPEGDQRILRRARQLAAEREQAPDTGWVTFEDVGRPGRLLRPDGNRVDKR